MFSRGTILVSVFLIGAAFVRVAADVYVDDDAASGLPRHRFRRATAFTSAQTQAIVDAHNNYRSSVTPAASNMRYMRWDDSLATMAQEWANGCVFDHGNPTNISPFTSVGQNIYASTTSNDGATATTSWYNEVIDYTFETNSCTPGKVCGHYTQVVWAESYAVGCGWTFCQNLVNWLSNAYIVVCNYGPAGNFVGRQPYLTGSSCTACSTGNGQCYQNQCRPCSEHNEVCDCRASCANCGTLNADCTCTCRQGWIGPYCDIQCLNTDSRCGSNPGWPLSWCTNPDTPYVQDNCPLFCGTCDAVDPSFVCDPTTETTPATTSRATTTTQAPSTTKASTTTTATTTQFRAPSTTKAATTTQKAQPTPSPAPQSTRPHTMSTTTPSITEQPRTEAPCDLQCANGGSLDSATCRCRCTSDYQGTRCQNIKEQVSYGVYVLLHMSIANFPAVRNELFDIVGSLVTERCNGNYFTMCCPGAEQKNTALRLDFVDTNHVSLAEGFPEVAAGYNFPAVAVMLLVTPPSTSDLCNATDSMENNEQTRDFYLDQTVLFDAISAHRDNISEALGGITVIQVVRGMVEEPRQPLPYHLTIIVIVAVIVFLAIVVSVITIIMARMSDPVSTAAEDKQEKPKSTEGQDIIQSMNEVP